MKVINLGTPLRAVEIIDVLGKKRLANADVRFQNVRLKRINELADRNIFLKNDLFMDATGLWDLMQADDGALGRRHHHHGLSPESIVKALSSLQNPELVAFEYNTYRHIVVTLSVDGRAMLAVIETNAPLRGNRDARINKLVTLYEKDGYNEYLRRVEKRSDIQILYRNKK